MRSFLADPSWKWYNTATTTVRGIVLTANSHSWTLPTSFPSNSLCMCMYVLCSIFCTICSNTYCYAQNCAGTVCASSTLEGGRQTHCCQVNWPLATVNHISLNTKGRPRCYPKSPHCTGRFFHQYQPSSAALGWHDIMHFWLWVTNELKVLNWWQA